MSNIIQSIVNAGPCRELDAIMQANICMFAETITRVSMFPFNEARVFCLSGNAYGVRQLSGGLLFVTKGSAESDDDDDDNENW
tara:strand:+ start:300 stop:548 length:249 start_codon:yes stop_codon:yes gene_type:complete